MKHRKKHEDKDENFQICAKANNILAIRIRIKYVSFVACMVRLEMCNVKTLRRHITLKI